MCHLCTDPKNRIRKTICLSASLAAYEGSGQRGQAMALRDKTALRALLAGTTVFAITVTPAHAQQSLPRDPAPFAGKIDPDRDKSVPDWPNSGKAPAGAPNVIVILIDDVGFGATSALGGPVHTPMIEQFVHSGLLYNNFHVNALCSPTRAALLSGRNDHEIGFGTVTEGAAGYPGYSSVWPRDAASIAEVLKDNGYSTAAFGKWHNTPTWEVGPVGPFNHWPTGLGFEYFYGFMGGEDSQWEPRLYRNTVPVEPGGTPAQGYHLTTDLANDAVRWLHQHDAVVPDKPFFLYFATGATHTPHHVAPEWIAKYKGKFDQGWDVLRQQTFTRQKALGVIPANAELTPRPKELPAWDSLSPAAKRLLAHQAEVYAAFLEQTDFEVGRMLQAVRDEGQWDNTLVLYTVGDNGASAEGGLEGEDLYTIDGKKASIEERAEIADRLGSDEYFNHYAVGWAWGLDTPFQWTKQVASHLGGTTDPLIVSWPARLKGTTGIRSQFQHVTDIAPTIYEAAGVTFPDTVNGVKQLPLEGTSLVYTFDSPDAPSRHTLQYFEMVGNRGIYKDGWWAGKRYILPWELFTLGDKASAPDHPWELYNLTNDYSQAHDLAASNPDKLKEMIALFDSEARRNNVYPLTPGFSKLPSASGGRTHFVFRSGVERIPPQTFGFAGHKGFTLDAKVTLPNAGAKGVILAEGGNLGGYSLYIKDGRAVFEVNANGHPTGKIVSSARLAPGRTELVVTTHLEPAAAGGSIQALRGAMKGSATLSVNGVAQGSADIVNFTSIYSETLDLAKDLGTPVSPAYAAPFAFNGDIDTVTLDLQ